jgi:glycogen(starch) synthase
MNILMITHSYYPNIGGVEVAVKNLCKEFVKKGHGVEIVTSRWPKTLPKSEVIDRVKVTRLPFRLPSFDVVVFLKFLIRAIECIVRLFFIIRRSRFDVINLHYVSENALYALLLSYFRRLPLITSLHGSDIEYSGRKGTLNRWIAMQTFKRSVQIVTNSRASLETALQIFGEGFLRKSMVIGNGVELLKDDRSENTFLRLSPFLLGVGRLEHFKGFDVLIKAFALVNKKFSQIKLVLVGDGPERAELELLGQQLGLEKSLLFYGPLEHKDVLKMLRCCEFFIMPSRREAFGIVNLEAMAAQKAVVAMAVGGVPEYLTHMENGLLVTDHKPESLANAIIFLLGNKDLARQFGINGRKKVEKSYTWEIISDRYLETYSSVL